MASDSEKKYALLSDEPVLETDRGDDLEFSATAEVLAGAALHTDSPITIGVFGKWGTGKTSLMRLMMDRVATEGVGENAAVPVWFNAWQYEREEHLIIPLIATIARAIRKREEDWKEEEKEKNKLALDDTAGEAAQKLAAAARDKARDALEIMGDGGEKVHKALRSVLYGLSMKGKMGIPGTGGIEISASAKEMIERYEALTQDTLMARSLYFDAFDQFSALSREEGAVQRPQIVVFIDDLDRCFPERAVHLLESIKLILHQPKFAFVLGIYPEIVEDFIRNKYAADYPMAAVQLATGGNDADMQGRMKRYLEYFDEYLHKIVQVRHYVPERECEQMRGYIRKLLDQADMARAFLEEGVSENELFDLIAEVSKRNPRDVVRKLNGLVVRWRIAQAEQKDGEKYNPMAGLINEAFVDRRTRNPQEFEQFVNRLEWSTEDEGSQTYGEALAEALEAAKGEADHEKRIAALRKAWPAEKSATMTSLIETLRKDSPWCNVLSSGPGRWWLSKAAHRKETQEAYEETEAREEVREPREPKAKITAEPVAAPETEMKSKERDSALSQILDKMVSIEAGEFLMGSPEGEEGGYKDERPQHQVRLEAFEIGATPVTQAQYEAVMGNNPANFKGEKRPVEQVSWEDAMVFCEQLTKLARGSGRRFTLPSEAQWEYACRAGSETAYYFGDDAKDLRDCAWYAENSQGKTHSVGEKKPNARGLYDMHGNVWEWCLDNWHDNYEDAPDDGSAWAEAEGTDRVIRGGSWCNDAGDCRSACRDCDTPDGRDYYVGFRVLAVPSQSGSEG